MNADGTDGEGVPRTFADGANITGVLTSGASASFTYNTTTSGSPDHIRWEIYGEKGSLRVEGRGGTINTDKGLRVEIYGPLEKGKEAEWKSVEVEKGRESYGNVAGIYEKSAEGMERLVDFEGAVVRHKMLEAIYRSAKKGTRESY